MTKNQRDNREEKEILAELEDEIQNFQDSEEWVDDIIENNDDMWENNEVQKLKDILLRTQADFENFKSRTQRDREDMIFFLKSDILKKILPRVDDLERIIKNTPQDMQAWPLFEWVLSMQSKFLADFEKMGVSSFESIWETVNPNKHDVMTQVPGWEEWIIIDEFEKGYELSWRILRHAKVVVSSWN